MRRTGRWLRAVLAASAFAVLGVPEVAGAHPVVEWGNPPGQRSGIITGYAGFCVHGTVTQEHAWHQVSTFRSNCANRQAAWHEQYQQYFKQRLAGGPAEFCFDNGWHRSNGNVEVYFNHWPWDIGHWCNYGGAWVHVYVDSWQQSWNGTQWVQGAWRPATRHCHCP